MASASINGRGPARALHAVKCLSKDEGPLCGSLAYRTSPRSQRQLNRLHSLFSRHGLLSRASQLNKRELWNWALPDHKSALAHGRRVWRIARRRR